MPNHKCAKVRKSASKRRKQFSIGSSICPTNAWKTHQVAPEVLEQRDLFVEFWWEAVEVKGHTRRLCLHASLRAGGCTAGVHVKCMQHAMNTTGAYKAMGRKRNPQTKPMKSLYIRTHTTLLLESASETTTLSQKKVRVTSIQWHSCSLTGQCTLLSDHQMRG